MVYWSGVQGEFYCLVMQILGPNIKQLFDFCEENFTIKTIIMIAKQVIQRLEYIHELGYIHRDIKPENIMIGQGKKASTVFLIDYGLVKRYICPQTGKHLERKPNKGVFGTTRYLSKQANEGYEQCRADDLFALGNILVMFYKNGVLPWDMAPLPPLVIDDKDPLIYQKTLERQAA